MLNEVWAVYAAAEWAQCECDGLAVRMSSRKTPSNPLVPARKPGMVSRWVTPSSVATATAVSLLVASQVDRLTVSRKLTALVPASVLLTVGGFTAGYTVSKLADWIRWHLVQKLFTFQGWMFSPRSLKTQLWGIFLWMLEGDSEKSTYFYQRMMPKQPLPDLDHTLDKWLEVTKWWMNSDEWECTKEAVENFRRNEGPKVQEYLRQKSIKEVNWVSDYWTWAAYLANRDPLPIHSNYCGISRPAEECVEQLARASTQIYYFIKYYDLLMEEKIPPTLAMNMIPMCMNFYQNMHGICRIPGEHMDSITHHYRKHMVVIRKGNFYKVDLYERNDAGKETRLSVDEIHRQLEKVLVMAKEQGEASLKIADLTAQNRTTWAQQREKLRKKNEATLDMVESSMFVYNLPDYGCETESEFIKDMLVGRGGDRWYDKCFTGIMYENSWGGVNVEHSVIDAMVFCEMNEYWNSKEKYDNGKVISQGKQRKLLKQPERLEWDLSGLETEVEGASKFHKEKSDDLDLVLVWPKFGKGHMKKMRVSPDGFAQMALQLTYYRIHKEFPKSYEPATGRFFALGRTETVHPASEWSVKFVKAMEGDGTDKKTTQDFLKKAIKEQSKARIESTAGNGCDRHLLGLLCASREMGMDLPTIFMDKAWRRGFKLSTSQTPNKASELGCPIDMSCYGGAFGPTDKDGYGVSYVFVGDHNMNVFVTSFFSSPDTCSKKFAETLSKVWVEIADLFA